MAIDNIGFLEDDNKKKMEFLLHSRSSVGLTFTKDGSAINLVGKTLEARFAKSEGDDPVLEVNLIPLNPTVGQFTLQTEPEDFLVTAEKMRLEIFDITTPAEQTRLVKFLTIVSADIPNN